MARQLLVLEAALAVANYDVVVVVGAAPSAAKASIPAAVVPNSPKDSHWNSNAMGST
jgi:hypothetical protein